MTPLLELTFLVLSHQVELVAVAKSIEDFGRNKSTVVSYRLGIEFSSQMVIVNHIIVSF
jgi:hypothetical protein